MDCEEALSRMMEILDGEAPRDTHSLLAEHLGACPTCRSRWESLRKVDQMLRVSPMVAPRPGLAGLVLARLERRRRRQQVLGSLAFAAGLGALMLLAVLPLLSILPGLPTVVQATFRATGILGGRLLDGLGTLVNSLCLSASAFLSLISPVLLCGMAMGLCLVVLWFSVLYKICPARRSV